MYTSPSLNGPRETSLTDPLPDYIIQLHHLVHLAQKVVAHLVSSKSLDLLGNLGWHCVCISDMYLCAMIIAVIDQEQTLRCLYTTLEISPYLIDWLQISNLHFLDDLPKRAEWRGWFSDTEHTEHRFQLVKTYIHRIRMYQRVSRPHGQIDRSTALHRPPAHREWSALLSL